MYSFLYNFWTVAYIWKQTLYIHKHQLYLPQLLHPVLEWRQMENHVDPVVLQFVYKGIPIQIQNN